MTQPVDPSQNPQDPGGFTPPQANPYWSTSPANPESTPQYQGEPQQYPGQPQQQYPSGQQPYPGGMPGYGPQPFSPSDERLWGTLSHVGMLFTGFIAPLIIMLVHKNRSSFVKDQSTEALNCGITVTAISLTTTIVGLFSSILWALNPYNAILSIVSIGIWIAKSVYTILVCIWGVTGAIKANSGTPYRYPMNIRFIK